jgi:hypothetical protein
MDINMIAAMQLTTIIYNVFVIYKEEFFHMSDLTAQS